MVFYYFTTTTLLLLLLLLPVSQSQCNGSNASSTRMKNG